IKMLDTLSKFKFNTHIFLSYGLPYETKDNYTDTINLIKQIKRHKNIGITICPIILDIGSLIYENPARYSVSIQKCRFSDWIHNEITDERPYFACSGMSEDEIVGKIHILRETICQI
ncbi:MAG: hypothetical protein N3B13_11805, partial [Deltaproteobacteria bacterium]|nr:hypothetical protein [Deltaproteobacteria bacterium]